MMKILGTGLVLAIVLASAAGGQGPVPTGEFQVNSYTDSAQRNAGVAGLADGGFVVIWQSNGSTGSDSDDTSIQAQRYTAGGTALGEQFQINTTTANFQSFPAVAALADGGFAAAWYSWSETGTKIRGRRFDADGSPQGADFRVDVTNGINNYSPKVAQLADGGFLVAWQSWGSSGSDDSLTSIQARRYDAGSAAVGDPFQVNSYTTDLQIQPSAAGLAGGGFVVAWHSPESGGSDDWPWSVQARRFDAAGAPRGQDFQVNAYTTGSQLLASVAAHPDGGFVIAWSSHGSTGTDDFLTSIQARRFDAAGLPEGEESQVNAYTEWNQLLPKVATLADGSFVVVWYSQGSAGLDQSEDSVVARRLDTGGLPVGGEFVVNTTTNQDQRGASVAGLAVGGFAAVWQSDESGGSDDSLESVQGQRFALPRFALVGLDGECLDVEDADPSDGTPVNLYSCHGGDNQRWQLDLSSAPQQVKGLAGKCLTPGLTGGSGDVRVVIGDCAGPESFWRLAAPAHAAPSILVHAETGLCLDVEGGRRAAGAPAEPAAGGTPVILFDCHGDANQLWRPAAETCTRDTLGLCLNDERFRVDLDWRSFDGATGSGQVVPTISDDSGLLWFFETDNWEMLVKVLDGCAFNERLWVFAAATTTVEYTLRVTDSRVGTVREYHNDLGNAAAAITDTDAFAACPAGSAGAGLDAPPKTELSARAKAGVETLPAGFDIKGTCVSSPTRLCLSGRRFSIEVEWRDYADNTGAGRVADTGVPPPVLGPADTSGLFWFFGADNWEMLVKVLDACDTVGEILFLGAATTDVEYTVTVTDTDTGVFWQHTNPLGNPSEALVHWFETCD